MLWHLGTEPIEARSFRCAAGGEAVKTQPFQTILCHCGDRLGEESLRRFGLDVHGDDPSIGPTATLVLESSLQAKANMPKPVKLLTLPLAFLLTIGILGCTLYPEKTPPTLATTTSAEQHERILWQMVQKQQWDKISPLFATTLIWNANGKSLTSDQVVPYLKSLNLKDAVVRDASIQPNGPDMTVTYTLQISSASGAPQEFSVFSVWQQLKKGGYILIAHSQQSLTAGTRAASR